MTSDDLPYLRDMLQDDDVMYAYGGAFSEAEVTAWFERQLIRYKNDGFGLWAVLLKETGELIGQCGLTWQDCNGKCVMEVGYLFRKEYWHHGYAIEAATACKEYAFRHLNAENVYSIIRDTNVPSQNVARRNGMICIDSFIKHYRGIDMPHLVFCAYRQI
jgi:RimJ/RimL family protein N-acetyltransferase